MNLIFQKEISLKPLNRGFHIITNDIIKAIPEINNIKFGLLHIFIKHTSASISINENADPSVRFDMESHFNKMVPEDATYYTHTLEGSDDMTSHIKSSIIGASVTVPVANGKLNLGTWQGIYLCEHRNLGGNRKIVLTLFGV